MPAEIEKNDVDVSKLFKYGTSVELENNLGNTITLYVRLAGDADVNRSRTYALRRSMDLRRKLKEPESDERLAYIPYFFEAAQDNLIETFLSYRLKYYTNEVIKNLDMTLPVEPRSDAPLEEHETYQLLVDDWPKVRALKIEAGILSLADKERERLKKLSKDEVFEELERTIIAELCEQELYTAFREMTTYLGTYKNEDYKIKAFDSVEDFQNLPAEIKNKLMDAYISIDIGLEDLKK